MKVPTKEIITPQTKTKVTLKQWITGGEFEKFQEEILTGLDIGVDGKLSGVKGTMVREQNHKALKLVVVSVEGSTGDVIKSLLDFPKNDYQFVLDAVNEVTSPKAKEQSGTDTTNS